MQANDCLINADTPAAVAAFDADRDTSPRYLLRASAILRVKREVAKGACGLCDQAHLCRVFRRITGMSPSAWRREMPGYAHIKVSCGDEPNMGSPRLRRAAIEGCGIGLNWHFPGRIAC
jgi:hypothetical protein